MFVFGTPDGRFVLRASAGHTRARRTTANTHARVCERREYVSTRPCLLRRFERQTRRPVLRKHTTAAAAAAAVFRTRVLFQIGNVRFAVTAQQMASARRDPKTARSGKRPRYIFVEKQFVVSCTATFGKNVRQRCVFRFCSELVFRFRRAVLVCFKSSSRPRKAPRTNPYTCDKPKMPDGSYCKTLSIVSICFNSDVENDSSVGRGRESIK